MLFCFQKHGRTFSLSLYFVHKSHIFKTSQRTFNIEGFLGKFGEKNNGNLFFKDKTVFKNIISSLVLSKFNTVKYNKVYNGHREFLAFSTFSDTKATKIKDLNCFLSKIIEMLSTDEKIGKTFFIINLDTKELGIAELL